jgi:uncharacterized protein
MGSLCLEIERIKETPDDFLLEAEPAWWEEAKETLEEPNVRLRRPVSLVFRAHRIGLRLLIQGEIQGELELTCGRCLEPYGHELQEPFQLLLEPAPAGAGLAEGSIELDSDDPELGRYAGDALEFGSVVLELLTAAWPVQPRCDDECRGLCPVCGSNRNLEVCSCEPDARARPFARLAQLLKDVRQRS